MMAVSPQEILEVLRQLADRIECGQASEATLKWALADGTEQELRFKLDTQEDRDDALLAIRTILGQIH